jgi:uridylate kinase
MLSLPHKPQGGLNLKKIVLSLGGSIMVKGEEDTSYLKSLRELLLSLSDDNRFIIITGGGRTARDHIMIGRSLGSDEAALDWVGIAATRLNAWLMISCMGSCCHPKPAETMEEAIAAAASSRFVIGGGTHPGHTTDAVAALIAERWSADHFINLTAVNGAYTADPHEFSNAVKIDSMTGSELVELVSNTSDGAGSHSVMDPLASRIIMRAGIRTSILNGRDLKSLENCLRNEPFDGTVIIDKKGDGI